MTAVYPARDLQQLQASLKRLRGEAASIRANCQLSLQQSHELIRTSKKLLEEMQKELRRS
jgi:prefoldin subunit 5